MTDARKTPEDQMLEHYREHAAGEPPSHLDAFILATAQREIPARKPGLWQRWVQACQKPRWQVAFAGLVGVALMLALVQRTPEKVPSYDFAPAPKMSVPVAKRSGTSATVRCPLPGCTGRRHVRPRTCGANGRFCRPCAERIDRGGNGR